jgi:protein subunit release factor B
MLPKFFSFGPRLRTLLSPFTPTTPFQHFYFSTTTDPPKDPPQVRQEIVINPADLEWDSVRGFGKGGQAVNKTNNCAMLTHKPTGIVIKCHETRSLETNKHYAIKRLKARLDAQINQDLSKKNLQKTKQKKQDDRRRRRRAQKDTPPEFPKN